MTVSANSLGEFTRNQILRRMLQKAGLLNAAQNPADTDPRVQQAADTLRLELAALQAANVILSTINFQSLALTAGQASTVPFDLPADTLDVTGTAMVLQGAGTAAELPVEPMGAEDWQRITDKTATGVPRRYYVERLLACRLYLWPGVDATAAGWTLRYRQVRLLKDADSGGVTLDLARYWIKYLIAEGAHQLALDNAMPTERCGYLRSEALRLKKDAMGYNRPRGPIQIHVSHRGGFR